MLGVIAAEPIGTFPYEKQRKSGEAVACQVKVFALQVTHQLRTWPEKSARETRWCEIDEALGLAGDKGLRRVIAKFAEASDAVHKRATHRAAA